MLVRLTGEVRRLDVNSVLVTTVGVGLEVFCPQRTIQAVEKEGGEVSLWVQLCISRELPTLYGFQQINEKRWFNELRKLTGVGAKIALAVIDKYPPEALGHIITQRDTNALVSVSGVGKRVATRILSEINKPEVSVDLVQSNQLFADAVSALVNMGFSNKMAQQTVAQVGPNVTELETVVKQALALCTRQDEVEISPTSPASGSR